MPDETPVDETRASRRELLVIYLLCVVLLMVLGVLWLQQRGTFRGTPVVAHAPEDLAERPIEINSANWWELKAIPGISENLARKIVELRDKRGGFKDLDELTKILGIKAKRLEAIRAHVHLEPPEKKKKEWRR